MIVNAFCRLHIDGVLYGRTSLVRGPPGRTGASMAGNVLNHLLVGPFGSATLTSNDS